MKVGGQREEQREREEERSHGIEVINRRVPSERCDDMESSSNDVFRGGYLAGTGDHAEDRTADICLFFSSKID